MKFLFDLFPVILFFITYKFAGGSSQAGACTTSFETPLAQDPILLATSVAIVATFCQVGWLLFRKRKVDSLLWFSLVIVAVFGGATIYFRNPTFIQWKPTILYWGLATAFLLAPVLTGTNLLRNTMGQQLSLPDKIWQRLNAAWIVFFGFMGLANLVAIELLSCNAWVNFKLYGLTGLMIPFFVAQGFYLAKYMPEESDQPSAPPPAQGKG